MSYMKDNLERILDSVEARYGLTQGPSQRVRILVGESGERSRFHTKLGTWSIPPASQKTSQGWANGQKSSLQMAKERKAENASGRKAWKPILLLDMHFVGATFTQG